MTTPVNCGRSQIFPHIFFLITYERNENTYLCDGRTEAGLTRALLVISPVHWKSKRQKKKKSKWSKLNGNYFDLINCEWRRFSSSVDRWKSSKKLNHRSNIIIFFFFFEICNVDILHQHSATSPSIYIQTIDPTIQQSIANSIQVLFIFSLSIVAVHVIVERTVNGI